MTKKVFAAMAVVAAMFAGYSAYNAQNEIDLTGFALANIEALATTNDEHLDCGNSTYIPNEALRSVNCDEFGLTGTHLMCIKENGICCNPADQTDCDGILGGVIDIVGGLL